MDLQQLKDDFAKGLFAITASAAIQQGICIQCKEPALPKCYSDLGRKEYHITALCEECFDKITLPNDETED